MASSHEHSHGPSLARAGERHRGRLTMAFAVILAFFVVQVVAAFWTNSLALLSDAGHMLTDVIGLGMALAAIQLATRFAERPRTTRSTHTFGLYRLEILAAFVNSLLLFGVAIWVVIEAIRRLGRRARGARRADARRRRARPGRQSRRIPAAARGCERVGERRGRLPRGARRHRRIGRRHRCGDPPPGVRVDLDRLGRRRGDRPVDPASYLAARSTGGTHPAAGGARRASTSIGSPSTCVRSTVYSAFTISTSGRSHPRWMQRRRTS